MKQDGTISNPFLYFIINRTPEHGVFFHSISVFIGLILLLAIDIPRAHAQSVNNAVAERPFEWLLTSDDELAFVPQGAIKDGVTYDHLAHLEGTFNTAPLHLWNGGHLLVSLVQISGGQPSARYIGDLQVASNIDASPAIRFYEFNYTQNFGDGFVAAAGLIDMNKFFIKADHASVLLNSSFGISPDISANEPVSIYPKPGYGLSAAKYFAHWKIQASIFQNDANDRSDVTFLRNMLTVEIDYRDKSGLFDMPVALKAGFWHHTSTGGIPEHWGVYAIAQQTILFNDQRSIGFFLQGGTSPYRSVAVPYYLGFGMLINSPFRNRPYDAFSIGMAKAWTSLHFNIAETAWEITYLWQVLHRVSIQPDLQFIQNPGGSRHSSALVGFLRLHLDIH